jgi:hypothetical protein
MLTLATILSWSILVCDPSPQPNPQPECVVWMARCLVDEYAKTQDEDGAFENCSESVPDPLLEIENAPTYKTRGAIRRMPGSKTHTPRVACLGD